MKKLLSVSLIVAATFATVSVASANTIYSHGYTGWASTAFSADE